MSNQVRTICRCRPYVDGDTSTSHPRIEMTGPFSLLRDWLHIVAWASVATAAAAAVAPPTAHATASTTSPVTSEATVDAALAEGLHDPTVGISFPSHGTYVKGGG